MTSVFLLVQYVMFVFRPVAQAIDMEWEESAGNGGSFMHAM
jgi:hypothetical protein